MKQLLALAAFLAALAVPSVALPASSLTGTYKTTIGAGVFGGQLKGVWTLKFLSGAYTVTDNGATVIHGKYTTIGDKLTLGNETGKDACPSKGTYTFKLTGMQMRFTRVSDSSASCAGRVGVLSESFTKTSSM